MADYFFKGLSRRSMSSSSHSRPEHSAPPELFYGRDEAAKYRSNGRMMAIQTSMAQRALELLMLPDDRPCLILDVGCGTGLSGDVLTEAGHQWVGMDISRDILEIAVEDTEGHVCQTDMGQGVPFRPGVFD